MSKECVFPFTNENVSSYEKTYNFKDKKVMSVLGGGDQYFSGICYGAAEIELYDCSADAWDFFVLKWYGISNLSYEDFWDYFIIKRLNSPRYFDRLLPYLPKEIADRLIKRHSSYGGLEYLLYTNANEFEYDDGSVIPYFNKEMYYQLQSMLKKRELPKFYQTCLTKLPELVKGKNIDILLTSNIFTWLPLSQEPDGVEQYKEMLEQFNCPEIQAHYIWGTSETAEKQFSDNGFEITRVPHARKRSLIRNDTVITLRRH